LTGETIVTSYRTGAGLSLTRSVIEVAATGTALSAALEQAVAYAREHQQLALWDRSSRPYAVALYDDESRRLRPLSDREAAILLNGDPDIAREWRKWNAMTGNQGSLIALSRERIHRVLEEAEGIAEEDDDVTGLA
jgi:hypothetical protein